MIKIISDRVWYLVESSLRLIKADLEHQVVHYAGASDRLTKIEKQMSDMRAEMSLVLNVLRKNYIEVKSDAPSRTGMGAKSKPGARSRRAPRRG